MDYSKIIKSSMKEEYAKEITKWNYEGDYSIYNLPSYEECKNNGFRIAKEENYSDFIVYLLDGEVIFYSSIKEINDNIYFGVGLKPIYCGKGYGRYFLSDSLNDINNKYNDKTIMLEVRSWNKRAIKLYESVGFTTFDNLLKPDRTGNEYEFVIMKYKKEN